MMFTKNKKGITTCLLLLATLAAASVSSNAFANDKWKVRVRGIGIIPDDSSNNITGSLGGLSAGVSIDEAIVPEVDITYMITPHWGVEAIAGIANHDVSIDGNDPTIAPLGLGDGFEIFDTWVLPPTVTLQYHFAPDSNIRPYVGVGVNYTATLFDDATDSLETILGGPVTVSTSNSWGYALQAGMDYDINEQWYFNVDVKYIDIDTTAKLGVGGGAFAGTNLEVDLDVNPFVVGVGVGYNF